MCFAVAQQVALSGELSEIPELESSGSGIGEDDRCIEVDEVGIIERCALE